jgi:hypothetical protein
MSNKKKLGNLAHSLSCDHLGQTSFELNFLENHNFTFESHKTVIFFDVTLTICTDFELILN